MELLTQVAGKYVHVKPVCLNSEGFFHQVMFIGLRWQFNTFMLQMVRYYFAGDLRIYRLTPYKGIPDYVLTVLPRT